MGLVNLVSIGVADDDGDTKRVPFYVPTTLTLAQIQAFATGVMTLMDVCIGGVITDATVLLALTVPDAAKDEAFPVYDVEKGALLSFDAAATTYRHSVYVPTWLETGFVGNEVVNADVFATFISAMEAGFGADVTDTTDKNANDLLTYIDGKKKFRK